MLHPFAACLGFLLPTPEYVCIFFVTYEHPLYRFIFLHRGRFVYCPFLLVRFSGPGACLLKTPLKICRGLITQRYTLHNQWRLLLKPASFYTLYRPSRRDYPADAASPAVGYALKTCTAERGNSPRRRERIFRFNLYQNQKGCVVLWNM